MKSQAKNRRNSLFFTNKIFESIFLCSIDFISWHSRNKLCNNSDTTLSNYLTFKNLPPFFRGILDYFMHKMSFYAIAMRFKIINDIIKNPSSF